MACFARNTVIAFGTFLLLTSFAALAHADSARLLDADDDALFTRLELIAGARERIDVAYFCVGDDQSSHAFLAGLSDAAERGVKVRLLIDSYLNEISSGVTAVLLQSGVKLREFHPLGLGRLDWLPYRLHDKLLVVDRSALVVGGRNISDRYFGRSQEFNFHDRDLLLVGSAAHEAADYFDKLWSSSGAVPIRPATAVPHAASYGRTRQLKSRTASVNCPSCEARRDLQAAKLAFARKERPVQLVAWQTSMRNLDTSNVVFLHSSRPVGGAHDISDDLLRLIGSARREILVESPYLVLTDAFLKAFQAALDRGVTVRLLTNSLATTNHPIAQAGYENQKAQLLRMGIDLWEYAGDGVLHGKSFVIDDIAIVGSYNLHPRSQHFDTEVAVAIADAEFAQQLRGSIGYRLASASQVSITNNAETPVPPRRVTVNRKATFGLLRLAAPILNDHL